MRKGLLFCLALALPWKAGAFIVDADTVALWHFDPGQELIAADSGPGELDLALDRSPADGSEGSTIPVFTTGCIGGALRFLHGTSEAYGGYGETASGFAFGANEVSVELLLRTTSTTYDHLFVSPTRFVVVLDGGKVGSFVGDGMGWSNTASSNVLVNDGSWHYVAVTYDGADLRVFVDGALAGETSYVATIGPMSSFYVGGRANNSFFAGDIDEARLSSTTRDPAEIAVIAGLVAVECPEPTSALAGAAALAVVTLRRRYSRGSS
ncbi:MAG: LamG domain-containing protein [Deltaproteobacteria bacterium]|nr:LamG domain-containing protein [Deltaproteobacteria bacterium]